MELVMLVNEEMDRTASEYRECLNAVSAELENVSRRLGRLYDALETGALALRDLAPRIQELRMRQEQLQTTRWELEHLLSNRKVELADMNTVASYVEDLRNLLDRAVLLRRSPLLRAS